MPSPTRARSFEQLQGALNSRILVEQAKGFVAHRGSLDVTEAFMRLRRYARYDNQRLTVVAQAVISRELPASRSFLPSPRRIGTARSPAGAYHAPRP